jgi:hypothetical protein
MPSCQSDGFPGAHEQSGVVLEFLENGACEDHGSGCDGHGVRADARRCANALCHREGGLHQPIQVRAGRSLLQACPIGTLELTENLRLAQDERIEAAGYGEHMPNRGGFM